MDEEHLAPMTGAMPEWLRRRAELTPERPALEAGGRRWTFAALDRLAEATARRLAGTGIQPGDRVATLLGNGAVAVVTLHALIRAGAVLAPLNTRLTPPELTWQLGHLGACFLLTDAANAEKATAAGSQVPDLAVLVFSDDADAGFGLAAAPAADRPLVRRLDLGAVHSVVFTSGTTGRPKGALLTYGNHWWNAIGSALNLGLQPDDRLLASLPLFHVGGMAILLRSVIYGCAAVVQERFDPAAMNTAIDDGATIVSVVAAMLQRLLDARGERAVPPTLRCVLLGGGPAPRPLLEACAARRIPVVQTYGLTESGSQAVTLAPEDALRKLGSAGKPLFPVELRIQAGDRDAAPGEVGEILLRGPSISPGYYGEDPAFARPDGWLHTGDLGSLDGDGYLFVADRRDDLIISGGENVYPAEVEAALLAHPAVAEAGVTGVPDDRWGQVPAAVVVVRPGNMLTEEAVKSFCAGRLARYKTPTRVVFASALPRTASGKLQRRALLPMLLS